MQKFPMAFVAVATLLSAGCATKSYVGRTVDPVRGKLDQVAGKTDQQGQTLDQTRQTLDQTQKNLDQTRENLDQTRQDVEKHDTRISAANERALSADSRAGEALTSAGQANQKADKLSSDLRNVVANLDAYKQVTETTVNFKFNSDKLSPEAKQALVQLVASQNQYKRFFIAVEGFTDKVGNAEYNEALSRRRANAVVEYLVGEHEIPIYRIHMVGLGEMKPVEDAATRAANAKNRRVEVTLFSADQNLAFGNQP